jgi:hypothetical protein
MNLSNLASECLCKHEPKKAKAVFMAKVKSLGCDPIVAAETFNEIARLRRSWKLGVGNPLKIDEAEPGSAKVEKIGRSTFHDCGAASDHPDAPPLHLQMEIVGPENNPEALYMVLDGVRIAKREAGTWVQLTDIAIHDGDKADVQAIFDDVYGRDIA